MNSPNNLGEPRPPYGELPSDADPDLKGSAKAIKRAARRARDVALQTGTDLIVVRDGKVVRVKPQAADSES